MFDIGYKRGVYSWYINNFITNQDQMTKLLSRLSISELYQEFPTSTLNSYTSNISSFKKATCGSIKVFQLAGDPAWYNDSSIPLSYIQDVVSYNSIASNYGQIDGIVFDIEPWSASYTNWESEYLSTIQDLYKSAKSNNLTMYVTIPYWLYTVGNNGDTNLYEEIMDSCDSVIVMNYNVDTYETEIESYINYAQSNDYVIYNASELQPSNASLASNMTYNTLGLKCLDSNWNNLQTKYNYDKLSFVFDDYTYLYSLSKELNMTAIYSLLTYMFLTR